MGIRAMDHAEDASHCTTASTPTIATTTTAASTTSVSTSTTNTGNCTVRRSSSGVSMTLSTALDGHDAAATTTSLSDETITISTKQCDDSDSFSTVLDMHSDATINSSELSSPSNESVSSSSSSSSDSFSDEYDDDDDADASNKFLLKPMPTLLQVCPVDDLAVEDAKRRRRHSRNNSFTNGHAKDKKQLLKRPSADAESLPTPPTPLCFPNDATATASSTETNAAAPKAQAQAPPQLLRRDSMAIRQQYWKQLGLPVKRSDLERSTGRKQMRHKGVQVQLNDAAKNGSSNSTSKSLFQVIASWYTTAESDESDESEENNTNNESNADADGDNDKQATTTSPRSASSDRKTKSIRFHDAAELFYIPLHSDYSKRQRDCMWHTRPEFVAMVERNLDAVYEEMEREYEAQCAAEAAANDAMIEQEAQQRQFEAQQQEQAKVKAMQEQATKTRSSPVQSAWSSPSSSLNGAGAAVPTLALCPMATQIKLAPRGRSTHDIRFKYLKHLGIPNTKKNS